MVCRSRRSALRGPRPSNGRRSCSDSSPGPHGRCSLRIHDVREGFHRHVRVSDDVSGPADQFALGEAADLDEIPVDVGDLPLQIGLRHDQRFSQTAPPACWVTGMLIFISCSFCTRPTYVSDLKRICRQNSSHSLSARLAACCRTFGSGVPTRPPWRCAAAGRQPGAVTRLRRDRHGRLLASGPSSGGSPDGLVGEHRKSFSSRRFLALARHRQPGRGRQSPVTAVNHCMGFGETGVAGFLAAALALAVDPAAQHALVVLGDDSRVEVLPAPEMKSCSSASQPMCEPGSRRRRGRWERSWAALP